MKGRDSTLQIGTEGGGAPGVGRGRSKVLKEKPRALRAVFLLLWARTSFCLLSCNRRENASLS